MIVIMLRGLMHTSVLTTDAAAATVFLRARVLREGRLGGRGGVSFLKCTPTYVT